VSYATWLRARSARLLGPALVFVAFWTVLPMLAVLVGLPSGMARTGGREVALPVRFLAVYLLTVAAAPPLLAAHQRYGVRVVTDKGDYDWVECGSCEAGWQVPHYAESIG